MIKPPETAENYLLEIFSALEAVGATEVEVSITRQPTLIPEGIEFSVRGRMGNKGVNVSHVKTLKEFTLGLDSTKHFFATLYCHLSQFLEHNKEIKDD